MQISEARKRAEQILDDERFEPTARYSPYLTTVVQAAYALAPEMNALQRSRPREVFPNKGLRIRFQGANYDLLLALLGQVDEASKPSVFATILARIKDERAFARAQHPLIYPYWNPFVSELPLVAELCLRHGEKGALFQSISEAGDSPAMLILFLQLEDSLAFDFKLFSEQELDELEKAMDAFVLRSQKHPRRQFIGDHQWTNGEHSNLKRFWQELDEACKSIKQECRKAKYLLLKGQLAVEKVVQGDASRLYVDAGTKPLRHSLAQENSIFDVFVSHATEDKNYVGPLVKALEAAGIRVWFDKIALVWGDDLRSAIDRGLSNCRYGIVVFSKAFLGKKKWTEYELNSLFALEQPGRKIILPIWHGITRDEFLQYGAGFADRLAKISTKDSYEEIVESLLALLGRSKEQKSDIANGAASVMTAPTPAKPNAIAYAWYETTGENATKAKAFIRPSTQQDGWFTFENTLGEEAHGTKEEIAQRFAAFDKSLRLKHYVRMQHTSSDPAFALG